MSPLFYLYFVFLFLDALSPAKQPASYPVEYVAERTAAVAPTLTHTPTQPPKQTYLEIVKQVSSGEQIVYSQPSGYPNQVVTWHNWLIFTQEDTVNRIEKIFTYNFDTGQKQLLLQNANNNMVSTIYNLDDVVYIAQGGYMVKGALYWADIPGNTANLIAGLRNPRLVKKNGMTIVFEGEGDSCWSEGTVQRLDEKTKTLIPIKSYQNGCNVGDAYLGIDPDGWLFYAAHESIPMIFIPEVADISYYHSFSRLPLRDPAAIDTILNDTQMPKGIFDIQVNDKMTSLLLLGKTTYLYDIPARSLKKIISASVGLIYQSLERWDERIICVRYVGEKEKQEVYSYELSPGGSCTPQVPTESPSMYDEDAVIKGLNLPIEFKLRQVIK